MGDPSFLQLILGGFVGSFITYSLTWWREHKRMNDAYRAPQREAIGGIIAATHELLLAESDFRGALVDLAKQARNEPSRKYTDEQLDAVTREFQRAILGIDRAFQVGRLTIVDATCYEKTGVAYNRFVQIKKAFAASMEDQNAATLETAAGQLHSHASQLNSDVATLIFASFQRVSPVQSAGNRLRRRAVTKRLREEFFVTPEVNDNEAAASRLKAQPTPRPGRIQVRRDV